MVDDFITGGILPIDIDTSGDGDFDPNAVESDDFLPDDPAEILDDPDLPLDPLAAGDDDLFEEI
jgi:hypothetical protein